jgi:thioester reductase-like protein
VLDFARIMEIPEVHHVSTAYVAGDAETFSESDTDIGQKCRNVYERTKLQAEKLVKAWSYGKHSIYRLGIVVGDTVTGWMPSFNGYYGFLGSVWHLRQMFFSMSEQRWRNTKATELLSTEKGC